MDRLTLLRANCRFLTFGLATAFFSSFGQTFFISLSSQEIRDEFSLSHGEFGLIYSCSTLASAGILIWAGRQIDSIDLRLYTFSVCTGLALFSLGMAFSSSVIWLLVIIFGLRFTGQGLLAHISSVSMARYFDKNRGAALSISTVGYPLGEAMFPTIAVTLIASIGWREMWLNIGVFLILVVTPLMLWLLKGHTKRHANVYQRLSNTSATTSGDQWTQRKILKDTRFYIMLPSYLAMPFIGTGFFFHQIHLANSKGWNLDLFVNFYVIYAVSQILAVISTGIFIDRFTGQTVMKYYLLPAMAGLGFIFAFQEIWAAAIFMSFLGMSSGVTLVTNSAIWAEIYGITHLGSIKALGTALMVLSTALSPPIMGIAIDAGTSMETIALASACFICFAAIMMGFFFPKTMCTET